MIARITLTVLFALTATAAAAQAQTIYKSVMPDGRVVFGNAPVKGAATVEAIQPNLPPPAEPRPAATAPETERTPRTGDTREAEWARVEQDIRDAEAALATARANAQAGVAPIPGEMVGNANNSFVRPADGYFARQQMLAEKVKEAQTRLDQAFAARNALR